MTTKIYLQKAIGMAWLLVIGIAGSGLVRAQDNVGPNEQRFNAGIYKASHNSYQRNESLISQIDDWNCWCLELDIVWDIDQQVHVAHSCVSEVPPVFDPLLSDLLDSTAQSIEAADRVTVIYLEMKNACGAWPARQVYRDMIRNSVIDAFGGAVYSSGEFKTVDQQHWPSYQELLRRGYHWVVILDEEETGFADDDFFFGMARGNPPTAFEENSVLVNSDDDDVVPNRGSQPDRWMFRAYPTPFCGTPDDEDYFDDAIANGYTFVATNCIDHHYTMTPTTHSASPVRVTNAGSGTAFGTFSFPYRFGPGLNQAVQRASTRVPIRIDAGVYTVPAGTQFNRPVVFHAEGGTVRISF